MRIKKGESQAKFFRRNAENRGAKEPEPESEIENIVIEHTQESKGLSVSTNSEGEPTSVYFKDLKEEISNRPGSIKIPKFRKAKKGNIHKNNIEFVIS